MHMTRTSGRLAIVAPCHEAGEALHQTGAGVDARQTFLVLRSALWRSALYPPIVLRLLWCLDGL